MIDYKSLFQGIPVGLYCTATDGRLLDVNPSLIALLHYPDRETMMAVNAARVYFDPDERLRWQQSIEAEDSIRNFETRYRCYDGELSGCENMPEPFEILWVKLYIMKAAWKTLPYVNSLRNNCIDD